MNSINSVPCKTFRGGAVFGLIFASLALGDGKIIFLEDLHHKHKDTRNHKYKHINIDCNRVLYIKHVKTLTHAYTGYPIWWESWTIWIQKHVYCNIEHMVYTAVYIKDILHISFQNIFETRPVPPFVPSPQAQALNFLQETLKALIAIRSSSVILVASWYYTPCGGTLSVKVVLSLQPRIQWLQVLNLWGTFHKFA